MKARQEEVLKLFMPAWFDHDKTISTLCKRPRRSSTNYTQDEFAEKVDTRARMGLRVQWTEGRFFYAGEAFSRILTSL
jgi:hypothetical protein